MANLNLSEFGEKTFVADADWTFVWDTAGAISKKVSRNNWLNSGTLATSAPVTISQTWDALAVAFTAFKVNATSTNSASGSLLLDLQLDGTTKAKIDKLGIITANRVILDQSGSTYQLPANAPIFWTGSSFLRSPSAGVFSFENNTQANFFTLVAEAANTLALRNGAAAQTFNVYNTYTDTSNYSRLRLQTGSGFVQINAEGAGTGLQNSLYFNAGSTSNNGIISFRTKDVERWNIASAGHLLAGIDNQNDIGASGANRPRNVYVGSDLHASVLRAGIWVLNPSGLVHGTIRSESDGVLRLTDSAINNFNRLQFGSTTSSFPALKRVGTDLQVVIASTTAAINVAAADADMTFIEDRFRRKGAGSPEGAVTAPIGAVYHRTDGGLLTSFYVKESGTGNTGWVGK